MIASTAGAGFTVIVKFVGIPSHPGPLKEKCGVTVIVAIIGFEPAFRQVNAPMSPLPEAASPISG